MEVYSQGLVSHTYDEEGLKKVYSINCIKAKGDNFDEEEYSKHPIAEEIDSSDFVYSIQNINNPNDEYGFCYGTECQLPSGNFCYRITAFIFDTNLPDSIVKDFASSVAKFLNQHNREEDVYRLRTDRLIGFENYPLSSVHISNTEKSFSNKVFALFESAKQGLTYIDPSTEQRLRAIAKKMMEM